MECKIKTDIGTIYINEDVMLKVVGYAALECYGIAVSYTHLDVYKRQHDAAARAIQQALEAYGVETKIMDCVAFGGAWLSRVVSDGYVKLVQHLSLIHI